MQQAIILIILFLFSANIFAQNFAQKCDTLTQNFLIQKIKTSQSKGNKYFASGIIPSSRERKKNIWNDNNIFFTSLTILNLQKISPLLTEKNKLIADSIIANAVKNYSAYKNKDGKITYNFWRTNPSGHFPNDTYFEKRTKYILPDDMDVTSLIFLTSEQMDSTKKSLKKYMKEYTNLYSKKIKGTEKKYRKSKAYNTWFGKKMPLEFDICVLCNTMYFVCESKAEWNIHDTASIKLICKMINENDHKKIPYSISPSYKTTSIILYHIARLLEVCNSNNLQNLKPQIITDIKTELHTTKSTMEKVILSSALFKLGITPDKTIEIRNTNENDFTDFYFFIANFGTSFSNPLKKWMSKGDKFCYKYKSEGYYWSLLLEYLLLSENMRE